MLTQAATHLRRFRIPATDLTMLLVVVIWGTNFSVTKAAIEQIPPLAFVALRFTIGALLLWAVLRLREGPAPLPPGSLKKLIWLGIIGNTIYQTCFMIGLRLTTASNSALLIATVPVITAIAGALLGIERLNRRMLIGILLAFLGVTLVVAARGLAFAPEKVLGDLLLIGCAISWAIYTLGVRTLNSELSPLRITTWTILTGLPGLLLLGFPGMLQHNWAAVSPNAWLSLLYSSVLSLGLAYILWNNSVRVAGTNRTAIYNCVTPLVAALAAWPLLGEVPTIQHALGAALIIMGVLTTRRGK